MSIQGTNNGDGTWSATLDELTPGTYDVTVTATDPEPGDTATDTATLTINEQVEAPVLTVVVSDGGKEPFSGPITGTITPSDTPVTLTIPINGTPKDFEASLYNPGDTQLWTLNEDSDPACPELYAGTYDIEIVATNDAGTDHKTVTLTVDKEVTPKLTLSSESLSAVEGQGFVIKGTVEPGDAPITVTAPVNGKATDFEIEAAGADNTWSIIGGAHTSLPAYDAGTYDIEIVATNYAGTDHKTVTLTIEEATTGGDTDPATRQSEAKHPDLWEDAAVLPLFGDTATGNVLGEQVTPDITGFTQRDTSLAPGYGQSESDNNEVGIEYRTSAHARKGVTDLTFISWFVPGFNANLADAGENTFCLLDTAQTRSDSGIRGLVTARFNEDTGNDEPWFGLLNDGSYVKTEADSDAWTAGDVVRYVGRFGNGKLEISIYNQTRDTIVASASKDTSQLIDVNGDVFRVGNRVEANRGYASFDGTIVYAYFQYRRWTDAELETNRDSPFHLFEKSEDADQGEDNSGDSGSDTGSNGGGSSSTDPDSTTFVTPEPVDAAIGTPADWPTQTVLTSGATGSDVKLDAVIDYKDQSNVGITAVAPPGTRTRALDANGTPTPISVRHFADGGATIENVYAGTTGDVVITGTLKRGSDVLWQGTERVYPYSRMRPIWYDLAEPNTTFDSVLTPNYGSGSEKAVAPGTLRDYSNNRMGMGYVEKGMGKPGGSSWIGLLPIWDACCITNPTNVDNQKACRQGNDEAAVWTFHAIDPKTNKMLLVSDHPQASFLGATWHKEGNVLAHGYSEAVDAAQDINEAHFPAWNYGGWLVYGTEFDVEETEMAALFCARLWENPGYVLDGGKGPQSWKHHSQTRGYAWALRSVAQASAVGGEFASLFHSWGSEMCKQIIDHKSDTEGRFNIKQMWHSDNGYVEKDDNIGMSTWQDDYNVMSVGLADQLGINHAREAIQYLGSFQVQRLTTDPINMATIYAFIGRKHDGQGGFIYTDNWRTALEWTAEHDSRYRPLLKDESNSKEFADDYNAEHFDEKIRVGDFIDLPASPMGYAAWLQPAIAYCVDNDVSGADEAWANHQASIRKDLFKHNGMYNIVPRGTD